MKESEFPMRLNKFLAYKGFATRRGADTLIDEGRVFVNGKPAVLGQKVTESDRVELEGYDSSKFRYLLYYKPRGVVTHSPEDDEIDIATDIQKRHKLTDLFPIGRLDKSAEGLIVLTDDGRITKHILGGETAYEQEYEVTVDRRVTQTFLNALNKGIRIEGYMTRPAHTERASHAENVFTIALTEGKKHHIRRMCATLGYTVQALKRTRILSFSLKSLKPGDVYRLKSKEAQVLQNKLGLH